MRIEIMQLFTLLKIYKTGTGSFLVSDNSFLYSGTSETSKLLFMA